ncbi:hypothetical protein ABKN59_002440 [Abortiporus biennis]
MILAGMNGMGYMLQLKTFVVVTQVQYILGMERKLKDMIERLPYYHNVSGVPNTFDLNILEVGDSSPRPHTVQRVHSYMIQFLGTGLNNVIPTIPSIHMYW